MYTHNGAIGYTTQVFFPGDDCVTRGRRKLVLRPSINTTQEADSARPGVCRLEKRRQ